MRKLHREGAKNAKVKNGGGRKAGGLAALKTPIDDWEDTCRHATNRFLFFLRVLCVFAVKIVLGKSIPDAVAQQLIPGSYLALRDPEGFMLAVVTVEDLWQPERMVEAKALFNSDDPAHPGVAQLLQQTGQYAVSGRLEGLSLPLRHDYPSLHLTPEELR